MIDYPLQFVLSVVFLIAVVAYLWRTRRSRLASAPTGLRRVARLMARCVLLLTILVAFFLAADATRYVTADVCIDFDAGSEWCLHRGHDGETNQAG